jgi:hypothetical protein
MKTSTTKKAAANRRLGRSDPAVDGVFDAYPKPVKAKLLALRRLILDTAKATQGVGELEEPSNGAAELSHGREQERQHGSYRPGESRGRPDRGLFSLPDQSGRDVRELYPELNYSGNRAILLDAADGLPDAELRYCVGLALTYHLGKRKAK